MIFILQQDPGMVEQLSKNITRQGLTNYTLNFLRVSYFLVSQYFLCTIIFAFISSCILTCILALTERNTDNNICEAEIYCYLFYYYYYTDSLLVIIRRSYMLCSQKAWEI